MTTIIDEADVKLHLNLTTDADDDLLTEKIKAAQQSVEAFIGRTLDDDEFPDGVPAPLKEAVRQMAAHLYENREPLSEHTMRELPLNIFDLVGPYRAFAF